VKSIEGVNIPSTFSKNQIEVVLTDSIVENATVAILKAAKTGKIGDDKVFVYNIDEAIRIRTDETGEKAI
jgi:nitrogen regulatory protein PII